MTELRTIYYGRNRLHTKYHEDRWSVYRESDYMYIRNARLKVLDMEECRKLKENYGWTSISLVILNQNTYY